MTLLFSALRPVRDEGHLMILALAFLDGHLSVCIVDPEDGGAVDVAYMGQWLHDSHARPVASGYCTLIGHDAEEVLSQVASMGMPPSEGLPGDPLRVATSDPLRVATSAPGDPLRRIADVLIEHLGEAGAKEGQATS